MWSGKTHADDQLQVAHVRRLGRDELKHGLLPLALLVRERVEDALVGDSAERGGGSVTSATRSSIEAREERSGRTGSPRTAHGAETSVSFVGRARD